MFVLEIMAGVVGGRLIFVGMQHLRTKIPCPKCDQRFRSDAKYMRHFHQEHYR